LPRQAVAEVVEPHQAQRARDLLADDRLGQPAHLDPEGDVLRRGGGGKERVALKDEPGAPPVPGQGGHRAPPPPAPAPPPRPDATGTKPAIIRKVVVLPQPLGPSSTTSSPCSIVSEKSRTA